MTIAKRDELITVAVRFKHEMTSPAQTPGRGVRVSLKARMPVRVNSVCVAERSAHNSSASLSQSPDVCPR